MPDQTTKQDGQTQEGSGQDGQSGNDLVQRAFVLGWHLTELYHFDRVRADPEVRPSATREPRPSVNRPRTTSESTTHPEQLTNLTAVEAADALLRDSLPGLGSLGADERRAILLRQVRQDLKQPGTWTATPDGPNEAELDARIAATATVTDPDVFRAEIAQVHEILLSGLTVADFRLGKSYGLGRALAETAIIPCTIASRQSLPEGCTAKEAGDAFKKALELQFEGGIVFTLQSWLLDLRDSFSQFAADAVANTIGGWALWMIRPTIGETDPVEWDNEDAVERVEQSLRRQGDVWRGLLSGEKEPKNIAGASYYFAAMASVVREIAGLAVRFLGTTIGLLLFLVVAVALLALYISSTAKNGSNSGMLASVIALLSALGITTGSVGAAVKQGWSKAEQPMWDAEVGAAVTNAAWHNPAALASVEMQRLLLTIGAKPNLETETLARHPSLTLLRNIPVGRIGMVLIVLSTIVALFEADAGHLNRDAAFFLPALCVVGFLAAIDAWDLLIGLAAKQTAPFLALPERVQLPEWVNPVAVWLTPGLVIAGLLAGHFFWH